MSKNDTSESRNELDFCNMCFYEYNGPAIWPINPCALFRLILTQANEDGVVT